MVFDRLYPWPGPVTASELLAGLRDRPRVLLNMVATVDGRATIDGGSRAIGDAADRRMFSELRAVADAVLVGTGTLAVEPYGRLIRSAERRARRVAAGLEADPIAVVWSRRLDLPWDAELFAVPEQQVVVVCGAEGPVPATESPVTLLAVTSLGEAVRTLRERFGVALLLCEGGPRLNRELLAEGVLDDLFLTLGPMLSGEEVSGIVDGAFGRVDLSLRWVARHGDELFLRYSIASRS